MRDNQSLAMEYHENTKPSFRLQKYDPQIQYKVYCNTKKIPLKQNDICNVLHGEKSFLQTLLARESTRVFTSENISLDMLSKLLIFSFGLKCNKQGMTKRTFASAGARYPIEVYVAILRSDDIEQGVYHYNVIDNILELIKPKEECERLKEFYEIQSEAINYPCLIFFSMVFSRTMDKYGERGYRYALIDAGHMSQNLYLVATYLELGVVAFGSGRDLDDRVDDIMGLNHNEENIFYGFAVGVPPSC